MFPGCGGADMVATESVCAALVPHPLTARTVMLPLALPEVKLRVRVVEVPIHPEGKDHE